MEAIAEITSCGAGRKNQPLSRHPFCTLPRHISPLLLFSMTNTPLYNPHAEEDHIFPNLSPAAGPSPSPPDMTLPGSSGTPGFLAVVKSLRRERWEANRRNPVLFKSMREEERRRKAAETALCELNQRPIAVQNVGCPNCNKRFTVSISPSQ